MERNRRDQLLRSLGVVAVTLASACGGEEITVGGPPPAAPSAPSAPTPGTPPPAATPEAEAAAPASTVPTMPTYRDEEFVENETNRDPFRNYAALFVPRTGTPPPIQRRVIMDATNVDEMRLIAIVSGVPNPSAMILDGQGTGFTVHRGDYVGRAEYVSTGGADSVPITLNWRVDRISPAEVVLTREDPASPTRMALTRVLPLHDEASQRN
jgi:type IV pilus assembly protein PilP